MYWVRIAGHPLCIARLGSRSAYYLIVAPGPVYFSRSGLGYVQAHLRLATPAQGQIANQGNLFIRIRRHTDKHRPPSLIHRDVRDGRVDAAAV